MNISKELLDILACPQCKQAIEPDLERQELLCRRCELAFPIRDDIPVMLIDEARKLADNS